MKKFLSVLGAAVATIAISGTALAAEAVFDSSTPPTSAPWMTRPCKVNAIDAPLSQNCYYNNTMGLVDAHGNHVDAGFWIRKIPHQPLICWIFSPDDAVGTAGDTCYSTTSDRAEFLNKTFYLNNDGHAKHHR